MTATGAEVPFISGMERGPPKKDDWREVTIKVESLGRKVFAADSMLAELLKRLRGMLNARGPDPDYPQQDDDIRRLAHLIERLASRPPDSGYREAPKESNTKAVVIGCTITLLCAFIIGAVVFSNEFSAFKAQVTEWQKSTDRRLEILERRP